jgi:Protein of unknown function (DUF1572)
MIEKHYIEDTILQLTKLKELADKAIAQIEGEQLFAVLDPEANSIAIIMKHVAGNMRSRWTEFLTSDGEKQTRDRDGEFMVGPDDTLGNIMSDWEDGWNLVLGAIGSLTPDDLQKTVRIRG